MSPKSTHFKLGAFVSNTVKYACYTADDTIR